MQYADPAQSSQNFSLIPFIWAYPWFGTSNVIKQGSMKLQYSLMKMMLTENQPATGVIYCICGNCHGLLCTGQGSHSEGYCDAIGSILSFRDHSTGNIWRCFCSKLQKWMNSNETARQWLCCAVMQLMCLFTSNTDHIWYPSDRCTETPISHISALQTVI